MLSLFLAMVMTGADPIFRGNPSHVEVSQVLVANLDPQGSLSYLVSLKIEVSTIVTSSSQTLWLVRRLHKQLPTDGFQEYDLFYMPSSEMNIGFMEKRTVSDTWVVPAGVKVKGIRVYGRDETKYIERPATAGPK